MEGKLWWGSLAIIAYVISLVAAAPASASDELILVHTLFRHGNRTIKDSIYDSNPYGNESFYAPYGYGQLTNEGKRTEYKIGQALRQRYDSFLDSEFNINLIDARSTVANRTKMSLLLVLASLFPPTPDLTWQENLQWQPIPYNTFDNDKELYGRKICTNYDTAYKKLVKTAEILALLKPYEDLFEALTKHVGDEIKKAKKVAKLYQELMNQEAYGYPVEDFFQPYLEQMFNVTILNYHFMAYTDKLKKITAGYFLRKVISDTELRISNEASPTKLYLYSAHETNIANLLVSLDVFDDKVPPFGSYVLIEVHRVDKVYGFKFYYQNYEATDPVLLKLPGCDEFCPLDTFKGIVGDLLPNDTFCELEA